MLSRHLEPRLQEALSDTPVAMLNGPRQSGKSTLARSLVKDREAYVTLDDPLRRAAALEDPSGFLRDLSANQTVVIDEIQRAPALLLAIKKSVDENRVPGRFLLTGSAHVLTLPRVQESLAGRMEVLELLPLSRTEIDEAAPKDFVTEVFLSPPKKTGAGVSGEALVDVVLAGGYPEVLTRPSPRRRSDWHRSYVSALVERDLVDVAAVHATDAARTLVDALAHTSSQLMVYSHFGSALGLDHKTIQRYVSLLEKLYLVASIPAWSSNSLKRALSTSKLHFLDSGLLASLRGDSAKSIATDRKRFGPLLETFVYGELRKNLSWSETIAKIHHYRDKDQVEVDFVIERADGGILGIEVKASATVGYADFRGLARLKEAHGERFRRGLVLYDGEATASFGDLLHACPVSALWNHAPRR